MKRRRYVYSFSVGEGDLDLKLGAPLVLLAKVVQGNRAVVGATVTAFVNRLIYRVRIKSTCQKAS